MDKVAVFQNVLDNLTERIYVFDKKNYSLLYVNKAASAYSRQFNQKLNDTTCYKLLKNLESVCPDCELKNLPGKGELAWEGFNAKDGTWVHYRVEPLHETAFIVYATDITAQKRQEKNYQHLFNQLINMYPDNLGSFHLNLTKNLCLSGSSKLAFVLRQKKSGTVDGYCEEFFKLIAEPKIKEAFQKTFTRERLLQQFEDGHTKISKEYPIVYPDGRHWREAILHMLQNPFTGDVEAITFAVDIDKRKQKELIINELVGTDIDFFSLLNLHTGRITEFGEKGTNYAKITKLQDDDYTSNMEAAVRTFVAEDFVEEALAAHSIAAIKKALEKEDIYRVNFPTKDNRVKAWRISYLGEDKNQVLIARRDVTDAVLKEREQVNTLKVAKLRAEKANEAKSIFLAGMSHDLRTPLNGIIGFTEMALKTDNQAEKQDYLQKIKVSGDLLLELVNDTLELSRIESGKLVLKPEPVDGRAFWKSVVTALTPAAAMRNVQLETDASAYPGEIIMVDQLKVKKVFLNIISNAIKYTPAGGHVKVTVQELKPPVQGCTRRLIVEDDGIGMSPEFMERMFEPFSQEHRPEMANTLGTGLGLTIVKRIVDLMQGSIKVESKLNRGSRFTIDLPLEHWEKKKAALKEQQEVQYAQAEQKVLKGKLVLLCEDNYLNAEIATLLLKDKQMRVELAKNGQEGVDKFAASMQGYYDAVLMDLRMPVMDGYEATLAIRQLKRADAASVPIIAMTADAFEDDISHSEQVGMTGYVTKPIMPRVLYQTLYREFTKEQ